MGTLVAYRYPTNLLARLADHTYVACGTGGKAWACWGGKTGGTALRSGPGSTQRADAIAQPNERARITCYLINGVCHQAANRILLPASITVAGARGYWVSNALFGAYGRPSALFGLCKAPFDRHAGVTGDLPECIEARVASNQESTSADMPDEAFAALQRPGRASLDERQAVLDALPEAARIETLIRDQQEEFAVMVQFRLGKRYGLKNGDGDLIALRGDIERDRIALEARWAKGDLTAEEFVTAFDALTLRFQHEVAERIDARDYVRLFDLTPDEPVVLADPEIAQRALQSPAQPDGLGA